MKFPCLFESSTALDSGIEGSPDPRFNRRSFEQGQPIQPHAKHPPMNTNRILTYCCANKPRHRGCKTNGTCHPNDLEVVNATALRYRILMDNDASRTAADLWLINSCTVKSPSQSQMSSVISEAKKHSIPVVVAGCVPQGDKKSSDLQARLLLTE